MRASTNDVELKICAFRFATVSFSPLTKLPSQQHRARSSSSRSSRARVPVLQMKFPISHLALAMLEETFFALKRMSLMSIITHLVPAAQIARFSDLWQIIESKIVISQNSREWHNFQLTWLSRQSSLVNLSPIESNSETGWSAPSCNAELKMKWMMSFHFSPISLVSSTCPCGAHECACVLCN